MSAADGQSDSDRKEGDALVAFLLENRTLVNYASIIMIIFAVWATVESITNALGMTWWAPQKRNSSPHFLKKKKKNFFFFNF